ncbi:McrC family protein [Scytonema sp. NUACC26]|uniref:McrC family protein n=1 Tax=Scytonema sp. NUACC26 TaxID=3140176 RepID=UPI0034DBBD82
MNQAKIKVIELTEYIEKLFQHDEIPDSVGEELFDKYKNLVDVEFPSYKTQNKWKLKAKGWVGYVPLSNEFVLRLQPKVCIKNLFQMLEYAYDLKSFRILEGVMDCSSLEEFYNNLAQVLAQRILERCRKGLYRRYLLKTEQLSYIRGRLDFRQAIQKPWDVKLKCQYEEQTADIPENQILAWTLFIIGRSGLCSERVSPIVRKAYHALQGLITLQQFSPKDCVGRQYNRLNEDYGLLHSFCRFFLENTAPSYETGDRTTLPFLVNMDRLYELFVAEWLKAHLPSNFILKFQERVSIGKNLHFKTDLVLYNCSTPTPCYILDTKYKTPVSPSSEDIAQVVAYGVSKSCKEVILVYPASLTHALNILVGDIRVRCLTFAVDVNLDDAGQVFLKNLLSLSQASYSACN